MGSALVTAGFVSGPRTPLFTSDLVKTEQVRKKWSTRIQTKKTYDVTANASVYCSRGERRQVTGGRAVRCFYRKKHGRNKSCSNESLMAISISGHKAREVYWEL